ncbi:MAG: tryptophan--tRNA ligase [Nitrospira sp.]|nr:tryptophan--tRNA ligase [Nitrospira sp.]
MSKKTVLSGIQPSGKLHIGNYVGALQNWVRLQEDYECYYFVADWHALTSQYADTSQLQEYVRDVVVNCLAAGLDPEKATLFLQSLVPEHGELQVLLSMITPLSWLERVPSYKDKQLEVKDKDLSTYGFLGYPLLQTADILMYRANYVPVGIDQLPHLEITREIGRRFNNFYGEIFPEPEGLLTENPKVPGVDGRKMSKTYGNCIFLADTPEEVDKKIRTMTTDTQRVRRTDPGDPELSPVFQLHKIFSSEEERSEIVKGCTTAGIGCLDCKKILIKNVFTVLEPLWEKRAEYMQKPDLIKDILHTGSKKARKTAIETMEKVREAMNLK